MLSCLFKRGRPRIETERVRVNVMVPADLHDQLLKVAGEAGCSMTDMITCAVTVGLPALASTPELISTLRAKITQNT